MQKLSTTTFLLLFSLAAWSHAGDAPKDFTNSLGMKFVRIAPGTFMMGSPVNERGRDADREGPQHPVKLTKPYYVGACHVTVSQFSAFVKETSYQTEAEKAGKGYTLNAKGTGAVETDGARWRKPGFPQGDDHPVVLVSWNDAAAFYQWLSKKEGRRYRLPTEAEWEYACRAGTQTAYPWGDDPEGGKGYANVADQTLKAHFAKWRLQGSFAFSDGFVFTSPVGSFKPNAFGLYDMIGNACQWCDDTYAKYPDGLAIDPHNSEQNATASRVVRGGSWNESPRLCRCAYRFRCAPDIRISYVGFRLCLDSD